MAGRDNDDRPFLGRGVAFPVRSAGGDIQLSSAEKNIREAITIILETAPGERTMRPDFGVGLRRMVFSPVSSATLSVARQRIREALLLWEPRIDVKSVIVKNDPDQPGWMVVDLRYLVRDSNTLANFVYPFYLQEAGQS